MRVLLIAPQPFFEERGTPIAIDLLARVLCANGHRVDLLTTHLGEDRFYPGLRIFRTRPPLAPKRIPPGPSVAKLYSDLFLIFRYFILLYREKYDVVHAVEEASFMAWLSRLLGGPRYVVDIDSSMTTQIVARHPWLGVATQFMNWVERLPLGRALAAVPVCESLADVPRAHCPGETVVLPDVSLTTQEWLPVDDIREITGADGPVIMYVGNLEPYQGIDLLLGAFAILAKYELGAHLVVIGGIPEHIAKYRGQMGLSQSSKHVHFIGARPVNLLGSYLAQADVLVSPRTEGTNTPMKIYSYMDSGRPLVATDIESHNQVLDDQCATLASPEPQAFAQAIKAVLLDPEGARSRAEKAKELVAKEFSLAVFSERVSGLYQRLEAAISSAKTT